MDLILAGEHRANIVKRIGHIFHQNRHFFHFSVQHSETVNTSRFRRISKSGQKFATKTLKKCS